MKLEKALIKYQFDEPQEISFKLLPNRLVNKSYCESLSKDLITVFGNKWEKLSATPKLASRLPSLPGIYMFVWKPHFDFEFEVGNLWMNYIVYIGKAGDDLNNATLKSRYTTEYSKIVKSDAEQIWQANDLITRKDKLMRYLNLWELEYWYIAMEKNNLKQIRIFENKLIELFNPPANKVGLRAKYGKPQSAF